jgi:glycosyltransferase involved in cell wall biosynthesis
MAEAASSHHATVDYLSLRRGSFAQQIAEAARRLRGPIQADSLLVDSLVAAAAAPWLGRFARRHAVIGIAHQQPGGADHNALRTALQRRLDLLAYRRSVAVIAVSDFLRSELNRRGIPDRRIVVVPPGRDLQAADRAVNEDLRQGRQAAIVSVTNWRRNKGIHLLLHALSQLRPEIAMLHLVGDATAEPGYTRQLYNLIARRDLAQRVVIHGSVSPLRVRQLLSNADILVHASRHEAYGMAVVEGMAAGLPVIAFRVDNLPYLVRDGIDGVLLPYGDVAGLAAAITSMAVSADHRAELGRSARSRAMTFPTWAESADRFFNAVNQVLSR